MGVVNSFGSEPAQPTVAEDTCHLCGACVEVCPVGVLSRQGNRICIDRNRYFGCIGCSQCAMVCPTGSITVTGRRTSPDDLVPLPSPEERATAGQLDAMFLSRRSVRRFTREPVPRSVIERVVRMAATAPMGIPAWEVGIVVFEEREKVEELARDVVKVYRGMLKMMDHPVVRVLVRPFMKRSRYVQWRSFILPLGRALVEERELGRDAVLYDAPTALLFHVSPYADTADAVIACTYAMLTADSMGLGTCMIGCASPPLAMRKTLLRKYGIPAGHTPSIVLIKGYPAIQYQRAVRCKFGWVKHY